MKLPCALIRDLLPLYHDSVCAPETSAAVEEHLQDCEPCREFYHSLEEAPVKNELACLPEATALQRVKKKIRLQHVLVAVCVLLACIGGGVGLGMWMNRATIDMPIDNIVSAEFDLTANTFYSDSLEVWGALQVGVQTNYPDSGMSMKILPMDRKGNKWVMLLAQRITVWEFVSAFLSPRPKSVEEYKHLYSFNLDAYFWRDTLAEFAGKDQLPPVEEEGCFISTVYYLSNYDLFVDLTGDVPTDAVKQALDEEGTIIWERPDDLLKNNELVVRRETVDK